MMDIFHMMSLERLQGCSNRTLNPPTMVLKATQSKDKIYIVEFMSKSILHQRSIPKFGQVRKTFLDGGLLMIVYNFSLSDYRFLVKQEYFKLVRNVITTNSGIFYQN